MNRREFILSGLATLGARLLGKLPKCDDLEMCKPIDGIEEEFAEWDNLSDESFENITSLIEKLPPLRECWSIDDEPCPSDCDGSLCDGCLQECDHNCAECNGRYDCDEVVGGPYKVFPDWWDMGANGESRPINLMDVILHNASIKRLDDVPLSDWKLDANEFMTYMSGGGLPQTVDTELEQDVSQPREVKSVWREWRKPTDVLSDTHPGLFCVCDYPEKEYGPDEDPPMQLNYPYETFALYIW